MVAKKIGIPGVLDPKDIANPNVEYLGVMAWVAQFQWIPDKTPPSERLEMRCNLNKIKVGEECNFNIDILDKEVDMDAITAEVIGPSGSVYLNFDVGPDGGKGTFQPDEVGMHELLVTNEGEAVRGAPHFLRSMPQSKKDYDGIEPCAVGSTVEVLINPHHAARPELLEVTAYSPTARPLGCPVSEENGTFYASFQPEEAGEWKIHVTYDGQDIEHSPFKCMVFNPRAIVIPDQEAARKARPGDPFTFTVDASKTGWGEVAIDVVYDNRSIRRTFYVEEIGNRIYKVTFTPQEKGKHRVYVYLHGMEVKGSPFSLRIGKDVREVRQGAKDIFRADRKVSRYKTHDEQRAERRNYYSEREIPVSAPQAPPRSKKKRQSFRDFREENSQQQQLFSSEHQTDDGSALIPIKKIIAFDCPADGAETPDDIFVGLKDSNGKKISNELTINHEVDTFTCEFTTSLVGEHTIEIFIKNEKIDATPSFYTYDATKIKVGDIPPGNAGMPVDFVVDGSGAGYGNLEIIVNGGRVSCHVAKSDSDEKFTANFIPHDAGRHRLDVKFNGDKVPGSPWFCEVKESNSALMAPGLLTGKIKASDLNGYDHNKNVRNGFDEVDGKTQLHSRDFSKVDSTYLDDYTNNASFALKTTEITTTKKESTIKNTYVKPSKPKPAPVDEGPAVKSSIADKKSVVKMEPSKDFGNYSPLNSAALLLGKKTATEVMAASNDENSKSFLGKQDSFYESSNKRDSLSVEKKNTIIEKESSSFNLEDSLLNNNRTYSTTLNTQVKAPPPPTNGFNEESFLIKADQTTGKYILEPIVAKDENIVEEVVETVEEVADKVEEVVDIPVSAPQAPPRSKKKVEQIVEEVEEVADKVDKVVDNVEEVDEEVVETVEEVPDKVEEVVDEVEKVDEEVDEKVEEVPDKVEEVVDKVEKLEIEVVDKVKELKIEEVIVKTDKVVTQDDEILTSQKIHQYLMTKVKPVVDKVEEVIQKEETPEVEGSSFKLERESAKGYFGSGKDQSKVSSPLFSGGGKANVGSENTPILDELSKNPLFARERDRSKSPAAAVETNNENQRKSPLFAKEGSKSPVAPERKLPIRRDRSKTPDRRIVGETVTTEKSSVFQSSSSNRETSLKEKSPVPSKRKTPPPVARKSSSPGRSMIPKRTPSSGPDDSKKSLSTSSASRSVSTAKQGNATSTTTTSKSSFAQYSATESKSSESKSVKSTGDLRKSSKAGSKEVAKKGSTSPKLPSYRGMADKCRFEGETVRHFNAGKLAVFELKAEKVNKTDVGVNIISPEKRPNIPYKVVDEGNGRFRIEFTTVEVGSYVIDVTVKELTVPNSPLIAKAYDAGLIKVTDIQDGVVGDLSTFRVDASKAGEGQLEISINDGDVPNAVQVLGGGKCLVTYTPEQPITHEIEVTFNGEQVPGSPYLCRVIDPSNTIREIPVQALSKNFDPDSIVSVELEHLGLISINDPSQFTIRVTGGDDAELAVSVQGPTEDIPVKVTGNVKNGFTAEFVPIEVGIHMILVEYNGVAVGGTPYYSKAYDSESVGVSDIPKTAAGKTVTFAGSSHR